MNYKNLVTQINKVKEKEWDVSPEGQVTFNNKLAFVIVEGTSFADPEAFNVFVLSENKEGQKGQTFLGKFNTEENTVSVFNVLKEITTRLKAESDAKIDAQRQKAIDELKLV
jgi:hypothetical protein